MIGVNNKEEEEKMKDMMSGYSRSFYMNKNKLSLIYLNMHLHFLRYGRVKKLFFVADQIHNLKAISGIRVLERKDIPIGTGIVINNSTIE